MKSPAQKKEEKWHLVLEKGHAVLPIAKPWEAPRMSEANVVSGGKGRIHAGEMGGVGCHMGDEKQRRKGKEEICKLYTQAVEVVIRARRGVKGIQLYRRNRNTSATLISSRFIITLQIKQLHAQNVEDTCTFFFFYQRVKCGGSASLWTRRCVHSCPVCIENAFLYSAIQAAC